MLLLSLSCYFLVPHKELHAEELSSHLQLLCDFMFHLPSFAISSSKYIIPPSLANSLNFFFQLLHILCSRLFKFQQLQLLIPCIQLLLLYLSQKPPHDHSLSPAHSFVCVILLVFYRYVNLN